MVVTLPKDIARMREADKIVQRWCEIQKLANPVDRVKSFSDLREKLIIFSETFL